MTERQRQRRSVRACEFLTLPLSLPLSSLSPPPPSLSFLSARACVGSHKGLGAQALKRCDLATVGRLMNEGHSSLRDDFLVSLSLPPSLPPSLSSSPPPSDSLSVSLSLALALALSHSRSLSLSSLPVSISLPLTPSSLPVSLSHRDAET